MQFNPQHPAAEYEDGCHGHRDGWILQISLFPPTLGQKKKETRKRRFPRQPVPPATPVFRLSRLIQNLGMRVGSRFGRARCPRAMLHPAGSRRGQDRGGCFQQRIGKAVPGCIRYGDQGCCVRIDLVQDQGLKYGIEEAERGWIQYQIQDAVPRWIRYGIRDAVPGWIRNGINDAEPGRIQYEIKDVVPSRIWFGTEDAAPKWIQYSIKDAVPSWIQTRIKDALSCRFLFWD